jgi:hypothetical protein
MKLSFLILVTTLFLGTAQQQEKPQQQEKQQQEKQQQEKKKEPFDPFADPAEELLRRVERNEKEKRFNDLKAAALELKELSRKMSDEIEAGGKDVISAKIWTNLDRAEKLVKTMREKAK